MQYREAWKVLKEAEETWQEENGISLQSNGRMQIDSIVTHIQDAGRKRRRAFPCPAIVNCQTHTLTCHAKGTS